MRRPALLIASAALVSHVTALGAGFVWLDHAHIEARAALGWSFARGFAGTSYYRPLMSLSLSIDAAISPGAGQSAFLFHLTSLLFHAGASLMAMLAAHALGLSRRAALYAGVLFAVHPLTTLVADAIAFRSEAMIAVALLGLIWAHLRDKPIAAGIFLLFGALTKETAVLLAPLFVLFVLPKRSQRKLLLYEGGALLLAVGLRLAFAPSWRAGQESLSIGDAIGTRLASVAKSTAAIALPIDRSICDAFAVTHLWHPAALAGLGVIAALVVVAYRQRGIALLLALSILPVLQIVPVSRWWSPHYLYIPLAFVAMLAAQFLEKHVAPVERQTVVVGALAALFGAVSIYDGRRFADDTALWSPEVKKQPVCREGQFYLGEEDRKAENWEAAARRYEAAIAPHPGILAYVDRPAALQNLGTVRIEQKRFGDARRVFQTALEGTTDQERRRELTYNLAAATFQDGDPAECARLLEEETSRPDAMPQAAALRKRALERLNQR